MFFATAVYCITSVVQSSNKFSALASGTGTRKQTGEWGTAGDTSSYRCLTTDCGDYCYTCENTNRLLFTHLTLTARSYANHEGAHCIYSWQNGPSDNDPTNGTWTTTCADGCKVHVQTQNEIHNGKVPQTGIYVRRVQDNSDNGAEDDTSDDNSDGRDRLRADVNSKVICNNEFGCHASDLVQLPGSTTTYDINHTVHDVGTGTRVAQPSSRHGASQSFVRKAVCKCNMGFTSPLQIQSSWCGNECPGPNCSLRTKTEELNEVWCDDLNDGTASSTRCNLRDKSMYNEKDGKKSNRASSYMENFYAEQSELRHGGKSSKDIGNCDSAESDEDCSDIKFNYKNEVNMDISESNLKSVHRGSAYNYYTTSARYAESDKFDDIAKQLYETLWKPVETDAAFQNLTVAEKQQKRVELKRFSCRHTYPACAPCSDLATAVVQTRSASRETTNSQPVASGEKSGGLQSKPKPIDVINWNTKKQRIAAVEVLDQSQAFELAGSPTSDVDGCAGTQQAPIHFPQATGYYSDANGAVGTNGKLKSDVSDDYLKEHRRYADIDVYNWYESNSLRSGSNAPMYYYCRRTKSGCDANANKDSSGNCMDCYVVKSAYSIDTNFKNACVHTWALTNIADWKVVTIRNSQAPWFTCFAADQCRQECRAAFGQTLNNVQTNRLIGAWFNGLKDDYGGANNQGWTGLGSSILDNVVSPTSTFYPTHDFFPRSTHYIYGKVSKLISLFGRRDVGTFRTTGHANRTLLEAMSPIFDPYNKLIASLDNQSMSRCPDDEWCSPYRTAQGNNVEPPFDVARFCALPEICPVRTHHMTKDLKDVDSPKLDITSGSAQRRLEVKNEWKWSSWSWGN